MPQYKQKKTDVVIPKKGLVIAHIGDGKGKTTAAMGIAIRASGAGLNVYILQFVKAKKKDKMQSGEWPVSSEIDFFDGPGLLILDEPTNHMNFRHLPVIAKALDQYEGAMILVSHVPEFVSQIRIDETLDLEK
jgi:ATP:corrinoid adenosyltransferase